MLPFFRVYSGSSIRDFVLLSRLKSEEFFTIYDIFCEQAVVTRVYSPSLRGTRLGFYRAKVQRSILTASSILIYFFRHSFALSARHRTTQRKSFPGIRIPYVPFASGVLSLPATSLCMTSPVDNGLSNIIITLCHTTMTS